MISLTVACPESLWIVTDSNVSYTRGAEDCAELVCATVLGSYEKLGHVGDQLGFQAHLLGVKTFCRRSFSPRRDEEDQNVAAMMDASR